MKNIFCEMCESDFNNKETPCVVLVDEKAGRPICMQCADRLHMMNIIDYPSSNNIWIINQSYHYAVLRNLKVDFKQNEDWCKCNYCHAFIKGKISCPLCKSNNWGNMPF